MMLLGSPDKKKLVTTIVATIKKKKNPESATDEGPSYEEEGRPTDAEPGKVAAMESFISASENKDAKAMASSLTRFFEMCSMELSGEPEVEEEG